MFELVFIETTFCGRKLSERKKEKEKKEEELNGCSFKNGKPDGRRLENVKTLRSRR